MTRVPLAEQMRPTSLDEVIGQTHLLGDAEILRRIVKQKEPVSLILWGPPGTGKTTLARIIAKEVNAEFIELSAVTSGKKDVEKVIEHARQKLEPEPAYYFIRGRNPPLQQSAARCVFAARGVRPYHTHWRYYRKSGALKSLPHYSAVRVLVLQSLSKDEIIGILKRALKELKQTKNVTPKHLTI